MRSSICIAKPEKFRRFTLQYCPEVKFAQKPSRVWLPLSPLNDPHYYLCLLGKCNQADKKLNIKKSLDYIKNFNLFFSCACSIYYSFSELTLVYTSSSMLFPHQCFFYDCHKKSHYFSSIFYLFAFTFTEEEEITFPPTYRLEKDTHERYAYTKAKATGVLTFVDIDFGKVDRKK